MSAGVSQLGLSGPTTVYRNLSHKELKEHELRNGEGVFTTKDGCFAVDTGVFTGRSPKDKWIVRSAGTRSDENIWWGHADLLQKKLEAHGCNAYLVNTGWSGGGYGVGERMPIKTTRACLDAILDGSIADAAFVVDPVFGFEVPTELRNVPAAVSDPREAWADKDKYDAQRIKLAKMFTANFKQYTGEGVTDYTAHGPAV